MSKNNRKKQNKRRLLEAQKAHGVVSTREFVDLQTEGSIPAQTTVETPKNGGVRSDVMLPIAMIKKDLIKNVIFMGISIALLVILKITNFGYTQISKFVSF